MDISSHIEGFTHVINVNRHLKYRIMGYDEEGFYNCRCLVNENVIVPIPRFVEGVGEWSNPMWVHGVLYKFE